MPLGLLEAPGRREKFPERTSHNVLSDRPGRRWVLADADEEMQGSMSLESYACQTLATSSTIQTSNLVGSAALQSPHAGWEADCGARRGQILGEPSHATVSIGTYRRELFESCDPDHFLSVHFTAHCVWMAIAVSNECRAKERDHKIFISWPTSVASPNLLIHCLKAESYLLSYSEKKKTEWYLSSQIAQHCDGRYGEK